MSLTGWIVYNGNLLGDSFVDFANMIQEAANKQSIHTKVLKNNELLSYLSTDKVKLLYDNETNLPDFVVFTDKDIYLAKQLEELGVRLFNSSSAIEASDDKIISYQLLAKNNLPIPKTIIAPKVFYSHHEVDFAFADAVANTLSFPLIMKEAFGSFGEQVYLIHNFEEMIDQIKELKDKPYVFQQFIRSSYGRDVRLQIVGDQVIASMLRYSENDFRANVTAGGQMKQYEPTEEEKQIAAAASKAIGADFSGVDLLFGPDGTPIVCEVNSNAHIRNLYDCTNINAADAIITHIKNVMK